jgi:hypothetical protein
MCELHLCIIMLNCTIIINKLRFLKKNHFNPTHPVGFKYYSTHYQLHRLNKSTSCITPQLILSRFPSRQFSISIMFPRVYEFIIRYNAFSDRLYMSAVTFLLRYWFTSKPLIFWFQILMLFRYINYVLASKINPLHITYGMLFIALVMSRLHIAGYLIIAILIFSRLEWAYLKMALFYRNNMHLIPQHFPQFQDPKRVMWSRAGKVIVDGIEQTAKNPQAQAIGVAVAGAIGWKLLDVHDTHKNADIADKDRAAAVDTADKDRAAAVNTADKNRAAANDRHREELDMRERQHQEALAAQQKQHYETLANESRERDFDRQAEYLRHKETLAKHPVTEPSPYLSSDIPDISSITD